jgi:twitching motility two-component system response regulator PilG
MSPAEEKALLQQGIAAARAGDKAAARARFRELTGKNFDNELAWLWLASVADTPAHAMACLRRVLQINPANDKARAALFRLLMEKGIEAARVNDKASGHALFHEASTIDPSSELAWTWLASTAPAPSQALDALRRVLQLNPGHDQAARAFKKLIVQQSIDLAQAGDPGACDLLREATGVDPLNETLWLWLARSVPADEAEALYERVLEINPAHEAARAALQQLRPTAASAQPMVPEFIAPPPPNFDEDLEEPGFDSDTEPALHVGPDLSLDHGSGDYGSASFGAANHGAAVIEHTSQAVAPQPHAAMSHAIDLSQIDLGDSDYATPAVAVASAAVAAPPQEELLVYHGSEISDVFAAQNGAHASSAALQESEPVQYETNSDYNYTTSEPAYSAEPVANDDALADHTYQTGTPYQAGSDVDSYLAESEQAYADSVSTAQAGAAAGDAVTVEEDPQAELDESFDAAASAADGADHGVNGTMNGAMASADAAEASAVGDAGAALESESESESDAAAADAGMPSDAPIGWHCPICLSAAPVGAVRCPTCRSVVSLSDPELLLETDDVDRRHVLQVVARLKNRADRGNFDHQFTLGLAYINANRVTEGLGHLRQASALRPRDQELKAQIDALERRVAQGARKSKAKAPPAPAAPVNGHTAKYRPAEPTEHLSIAPRAEEPMELESGAGDPPVESSSDSRRIILVVDDSPTIQKVVSVTLEAHGHEVVTASDGMEALSKLRTIRPDLVLLDITMPHMDGYQLCRILRSNDLTRQVPIVMLSGKDGLFDKMRGRMAGAASYITKPFAPSALPPLVEKYCKRVG